MYSVDTFETKATTWHSLYKTRKQSWERLPDGMIILQLNMLCCILQTDQDGKLGQLGKLPLFSGGITAPRMVAARMGILRSSRGIC